MNFASRYFAEFNKGFLVFAVATNEVVFVKTDGGDGWRGVGVADKTVIIDRVFGLIDKVRSEDGTFVVGEFGR